MSPLDLEFLNTIQEFKLLKIDQNIDFEKYNSYAITAHSTAIEGSTLSVNDTTLLIDNKMPISGKSMLELDMVRDHQEALIYTRQMALKRQPLSVELIKEINRKLMRNSGKIINTVLGEFNTSNGDIRKFAVLSNSGGYYMNHEKVSMALNDLINETNRILKSTSSPLEIHNLAFDFHYSLVTIHPFGDGNGRVSRLLMNYIQWFHNEMPTYFNSSYKNEYITALMKTRETNDYLFIRNFLKQQHINNMATEIQAFKRLQSTSISQEQNNKDGGLSFIIV